MTTAQKQYPGSTHRIFVFYALARERYRIKLRRELGDQSGILAPGASTCVFGGIPSEDLTCRCMDCEIVRAGQLTRDPVFQKYRFCNVFREDDKTTKWFRDNVRDRLRNNGLDVLHATILFRWFNRISTAERIPRHLFRFDGYKEHELRSSLAEQHPLVTGAYMIKTPAGMSKLEGILKCIRDSRSHLKGISHRILNACLCQAHTELKELPFLGSFMAYEIVTDLRHTCLLEHAPDKLLWAAPGPGAARGLGYVYYNDPERFSYTSQRDKSEMLELMQQLLHIGTSEAGLWPIDWPQWEMREVEHWLCEVWKYIRFQDYGGRPKELFRRSADVTN